LRQIRYPPRVLTVDGTRPRPTAARKTWRPCEDRAPSAERFFARVHVARSVPSTFTYCFRMRPRVPRGRQQVRRLRRIALMSPFLGRAPGRYGWNLAHPVRTTGSWGAVAPLTPPSSALTPFKGLKRAVRAAFNADNFCGQWPRGIDSMPS
jgi:hypothetical protein